MKAFKRAAFVVSLLVLILGLIGQMVFMPRFDRTERPPSDLPADAAHRTIWRDSADTAPRPGERVLELVANNPTPFAPHYAEPLLQAAVMAQRADAALVVTLDDITIVTAAAADPQFVGDAVGRIEEVLLNRPGWPLAVGSTLTIGDGIGGRAQGVRRVDGVQIVKRAVFRRMPRDGGRYLVFLHMTRNGPPVASFGYGNAFEIRGTRLVAMSVPDGGTWRQSADAERTLTLVRTLGARPIATDRAWIPPPGLAP